MEKVIHLVSGNPDIGGLEAELLRELRNYRDEVDEQGKTFTFEVMTLEGTVIWLRTEHHDTGSELAAVGPYRRGLIASRLEAMFGFTGGDSHLMTLSPQTEDRKRVVYRVTKSKHESVTIFDFFPKKR